jgi:predicted Zn finger-like uncharacterized protein
LYTQCSHCDTVFQLTADTLRAAGGQVRCGRCGEVFNALARLAEDANAFPTPGEGSPGESALEMEARADEILHSPTPTRPAPPEPAPEGEDFEGTDGEFARLQLIEKFTPPGDEMPAPLRRTVAPTAAPPASRAPPAFSTAPASGAAPAPGTTAASVTSPRAPALKAKPAPPTGAAAGSKSATKDVVRPRAPVTGTPIDPESADDGALEFTLPPGELDRIFVDPTAARAHPTPGLGADTEASAPNARAADESTEPAAERMDGLDVAEHVRRDVLAGLRQRRLDDPGEAAQPAARLAWGGAGALLALVLLGQMLHENRAWLAVHGPMRGPLQGLYAALGVKVQQPVNLSAYQLRQWGVTGDPNAAGTLRLRASILNASAQLQPYPLLRVTLANRFGTRIGTRDFEAAEYLGHSTVRLMTPGERADATLDIQDPGKDAEGFEIDVCLRADQTVSCAADAATQAGAPPAGATQAAAPQASAPRAGAPPAKP